MLRIHPLVGLILLAAPFWSGDAQLLPNGATVIFEERFNGPSLNPASWSVIHRAGDYSNHEVQCYRPANIRIGNGVLTMTSEAQSILCGDVDHPRTPYSYTSAMVQWSTFSFTYGTVEVRAKTAGGQGSWPAIWLLGSQCQASNALSADNIGTCNWPNAGSEEIDIAELANSTFTSVSHNFFNGSSYFCQQPVTDTSQNWHVYALHWKPDRLSFSIDGVPADCVFTEGVPSAPMFLIINNAMGGLAGPVNNADFPQSMLIDYVRVYQP